MESQVTNKLIHLSSEIPKNLPANLLIGNRFPESLPILCHAICKQCLWVKCWRSKSRAEKAEKARNLKTKKNKSKHKLWQVQTGKTTPRWLNTKRKWNV